MRLGVEQTTNGQGSALDRIRAKHKASRANDHLDLAVPGFDGEMAVRYRPIEEEDVGRLMASASDVKAQVAANLDGLIAAHECILVRDESGEFEPLTRQGEPVRFDDTLAEILHDVIDLDLGEDPTVRQIVLGLFSKVPAPYMGVGGHAIEVVKWMAGEENTSLQKLLGES